MELLSQVSNVQFLYPAAAVAVVLICAALVFIFGFHSAEQPQFDKLSLVLDDRKSSNKKRKIKEKVRIYCNIYVINTFPGRNIYALVLFLTCKHMALI